MVWLWFVSANEHLNLWITTIGYALIDTTEKNIDNYYICLRLRIHIDQKM